MYISITELHNVNVVGNNFRITEYYPVVSNGVITVPVEQDRIHPCFIEVYNRNAQLVQLGHMVPMPGKIDASLSLEEYRAGLEELLNNIVYLYPDMNIYVDNIEKMYSMWIQSGLTYCISGILNVTTHAGDIYMSNFKEFWIPEFDIGTRISKQQFLNSVKRFIPEITSSVLMSDALYKFATEYIMDDDASIIFNANYSTEEMTNFITGLLPNMTAEKLLNIINSRIDVNLLYDYYDHMGRLNFAPAVAKALLYYHANVINATRTKVRTSFGLPENNIDMVLTLPADAYLNVHASKDNAVISIM
jgi:hypothetical protein